MKNERLSTGIATLDLLLHGGLMRGRTYVYAGQPGSGKTIACLQFVVAALKRAEKIVYVTVDERPAEILDSAASFDWQLQASIQDKNLVILDAAPYFGGRGGGEKGIDPQKIVTDLATYAKRLSATLLIIDPVTPLILPGESSAAQDQARSFIQLVQTQIGATTILTAHHSAASPSKTGEIEEYLASGVVLFRAMAKGDHVERTLTIKKMRGISVDPVSYPFHFSPGAGIVIDRPDDAPISQESTGLKLELFEAVKAAKALPPYLAD